MRMMFYAAQPFTLTLSQSLWQPDIRALALAAGWNGASALYVNLTASLIGPIDLGTSSFPSGITINVSSTTRIGGVPGAFGVTPDGGPALRTRVPVSINNLGTISGGGGPGGRGGSANSRVGNASTSVTGGNGGRGQGLVAAAGGLCAEQTRATGQAGGYQTDTDTITPPYPSCWSRGGQGGQGGAWGQAGARGDSGTWGGSSGTTGTGNVGLLGGDAGAAVDGNSYVAWIATGTRLGGLIG